MELLATNKSPLIQKISYEPTIKSPVFGHPDIVNVIQTSRIFKDSKTFVDLKLKRDPLSVQNDFETLVHNNPKLSIDLLKHFVIDSFDLSPEAEFEDWDPQDWSEDVGFLLNNIKDPSLRFALIEVHVLWKVLSKKSAQDIIEKPYLSTLVTVPNGFIIPGGRFKETYYWDTYWIIRGLLLSNMIGTAKGIIENFLYMIEQYGFIPNGTRTYYLHRSQPPYLISMIHKYALKSDDWKFVEKALPLLEQEMAFFEGKRSLEIDFEGRTHRVFRYGSDCCGPRPEAYVEDSELAEHFETSEEKEEFFLHIKSAAESGWDFSSRWMIAKDGTNRGTLLDAKTNLILPVDLNALMFKNYSDMSRFFARFGDDEKASLYKRKAMDLLNAITVIFWDPNEEMWFDFDLINNKRRLYFYASNLVPLWAKAYPEEQTDQVAAAAISYMDREGVIDHEGGVPASKMKTGQQWDFYCWPPLQHMIVSGLNKTKNANAERVAFNVAKTYVKAALVSCDDGTDKCLMYEKYDPEESGMAGGGGEYEVQVGFGWSNGVLIDFISLYGDDIVDEQKIWPGFQEGQDRRFF